MGLPLLSILIGLPVVTAVLCALAPARSAGQLARLGVWLTFLFAAGAMYLLSPSVGMFGHVEQHPWLTGLNVQYKVGVDGPAMLLILLTTFLSGFAVEASQNVIQERTKSYYALLLCMEAAMIGAFCALDLVLFYIFFEAVLIPAYFLIGIWGGPRRAQASLTFLLYTLVGSLLMLVSIIALYLVGRTADFTVIQQALATHPLPGALAAVAFGGFVLAFAIKTPLFPFHTWSPDTYAEAPTPVAIVIAGAMGKLGTYGFYRFVLQLFPDLSRQAAPIFVGLGVVAIIYGALVAAMQRDIKRLIAYSSVSHLGFVVMGLFSGNSQGVTGAVLQMINHGVSTGALFLIASMLQERRGTSRIASFGGLWEQMPVFGRFFLIVTLSSIALPLTNGFVGEFLILLGTFQTYPLAAILATTGVIWSAVYMLWMFQRVMYGPVDKPENRRLRDLSSGESLSLAVFVAAIFLFGIAPTLFTRYTEPSVNSTVRAVNPEAGGDRAFGMPPGLTPPGRAEAAPTNETAPEPRGEEATPTAPALP